MPRGCYALGITGSPALNITAIRQHLQRLFNIRSGESAAVVLAPAAVGIASGQVFYVWFSVFNLFATMLFWALLADRFSLEQSKRLFALIAVGGTLGAIFGPWLASLLARPLGTPALLLVSAGFLLLALTAAWAALGLWLGRAQQQLAAKQAAAVSGTPEPIPGTPSVIRRQQQ